MGCDIHCYVEYKRPDWKHWSGFGGRINPGRSYFLFSKMAGVRNSGEIEPVVPPRGFPADCAYVAERDNYLYVTDTEGEGYCTAERAEHYIEYGSQWKDETKKFVTHPDWHTHSWLTPNEFEKAIEEATNEEYRAILAAMRSFESQGFAARLVFWFDN